MDKENLKNSLKREILTASGSKKLNRYLETER